ncbi:MAG: bifunctional [glutamate--ammonia ligase]-adenylyl-L-tyrosine phosphorylase/[glutamate--ammonia-ligase] adenylyltransferase [Gammaproteobacteria bacterium]
MKLDDILIQRAQQVQDVLQHTLSLPADKYWQTQLFKMLVCSEYVASLLSREPQLLQQLVNESAFSRLYSRYDYQRQIRQQLATVTDELQLMRQLRVFRHQHMMRIIWRDVNNLATLKNTLEDLSNLADACIQYVMTYLYQKFTTQHGFPCNEQNYRQHIIVIAVGKLGARELNFSSDIDLLFCYPSRGYTSKSHIANQQFFTQLVQQFIKLLGQKTQDGFLYRVDVRLRPFGQAGSLVMTIDELQNYYQNHGRAWERYVLVKARIIYPRHNEHTKALKRLLRAFVYRHYVDYSVIESLRDMKKRIEANVRQKNLTNDIKSGPGGIRFIEFIVQVFQIIRGGQERRLQQPNLLRTLSYLGRIRALPAQVIADLTQAYSWLRQLENRIQMVFDRQTHQLPISKIEQNRLAYALNEQDWPALEKLLATYRQVVIKHFADVIAEPQTIEDAKQTLPQILHIIKHPDEESTNLVLLQKCGFIQVAQINELITGVLSHKRYKKLTTNIRLVFDNLFSRLIALTASCTDQVETLRRALDIFEAIMRRSVYLTLLNERPQILPVLVQLADCCAWLCEKIAQFPLLLDKLLHVDAKLPHTRSYLAKQVRHYLADCEDSEQAHKALQRFHMIEIFNTAISETVYQLPLMQVSDRLAIIAEIVLENVYQIALDDVTSRFQFRNRLTPEDCPLMMVAYGKLGGGEMSYISDLDLIFIYDNTITQCPEISLLNQEFYLTVARRILHLLQARTTMGILYQIDTRLRPSGNAGLLVTSFDAFAEYQRNTARTWEHQALVRARAINGPAQLQAKFQQFRRELLTQQRDINLLRTQIDSMRQQMREQLLLRNKGFYDIKQASGGMVDIEFLSQFLVLGWSHLYSSLVEYADCIHIFKQTAQLNLLTPSQTELLINAYRQYRQIQHRRILMNVSERQIYSVPEAEVNELAKQVIAVWQSIIKEPSDGR